MRLDPDGFFHLTYCTNIHPADGWPAVFDNIRRIAPVLKARLSPAGPFGLGLRLSAREAREPPERACRDAPALCHSKLQATCRDALPLRSGHRDGYVVLGRTV